jgi:hypothetical protein
VDVILEVCRLFGLHSRSVSHIGRHYLSVSPIWTSILTRVPFGRHYSSLSLIWTPLFKCVSYVDVILEVCRLFGRHSWSVSHFGRHYSSLSRIWTSLLKYVATSKRQNGWLTLCSVAFIIPCKYTRNRMCICCKWTWRRIRRVEEVRRHLENTYSVGVHLFTLVEWA